MPTYQTPGVYVEEGPLTPAITGVGTSTAALIGVSTGARMPPPPQPGLPPYTVAPLGEPIKVTSFDQFKRGFGDFDDGNRILAHSVYGFFNNGGSVCYVARVDDIADLGEINGVLAKLAAIDEIAIVAVPGAVDEAVQGALISHCSDLNLQDRVAVLDGRPVVTPTKEGILGGLTVVSDYAALYWPYVRVRNPDDNKNFDLPPSGLVAGVYARVDTLRGVHKAPANEILRGVLGLAYQTSKADQGDLNDAGINVIRTINGAIRVWGARTLAATDNSQIRYVNVRRLMNFLRESIDEGTQFAVFEPNSDALWQQITRSVTAFLTRVWRDGALFGLEPEQAFYVKCDASTNPPEVREVGQVIIEVGVAPVTPAEFVVFRISRFPQIPAN